MIADRKELVDYVVKLRSEIISTLSKRHPTATKTNIGLIAKSKLSEELRKRQKRVRSVKKKVFYMLCSSIVSTVNNLDMTDRDTLADEFDTVKEALPAILEADDHSLEFLRSGIGWYPWSKTSVLMGLNEDIPDKINLARFRWKE